MKVQQPFWFSTFSLRSKNISKQFHNIHSCDCVDWLVTMTTTMMSNRKQRAKRSRKSIKLYFHFEHRAVHSIVWQNNHDSSSQFGRSVRIGLSRLFFARIKHISVNERRPPCRKRLPLLTLSAMMASEVSERCFLGIDGVATAHANITQCESH